MVKAFGSLTLMGNVTWISSQASALIPWGHNHPRIMKVIAEQAHLLIHTSNLYYHQYQGPLAKRISEASGLARIFFGNTGTEVVEGALKMAKAHGKRIGPDKYEIISLENSFHGRSLGALSVTGQSKYRNDFEPLLPGAKFVQKNLCSQLEAAFSDRTAGMILEVIQGEGGIFPVCDSYLAKARELCDRYNALLIYDETQCGVGRPGTLLRLSALRKKLSCRTSWWPQNRLPAGCPLAS